MSRKHFTPSNRHTIFTLYESHVYNHVPHKMTTSSFPFLSMGPCVLLWNNYNNTIEIPSLMLQQPNKYSIKTKLQQHLALQHQQPSTPVLTPPLPSPSNAQMDHEIYMPEYHNYFLHTIQKEIKHEGNLLKRIRRKIDDFKGKQQEKKRIKNAKHYYSHLMFNSTPIRGRKNSAKMMTMSNTMTSTPMGDFHRTIASSAAVSTRHTQKVKTNSFSNKSKTPLRIKTATPTRQSSTHQSLKTFHPSRASFYSEKELIEKFGKLAKQSRRGGTFKDDGFAVTGGRPQWERFQSYRNGNSYLVKKME